VDGSPISCSEILSFKSWPRDWLTLLKFFVIWIGCSSQNAWKLLKPGNCTFQFITDILCAPLTLAATAACDTPALYKQLTSRRSFWCTSHPPPGLILWPLDNVTRCGEFLCVWNALGHRGGLTDTDFTWRLVCAIYWATQRHRLCGQTHLSRRRI
jgi:hypothetical protein